MGSYNTGFANNDPFLSFLQDRRQSGYGQYPPNPFASMGAPDTFSTMIAQSMGNRNAQKAWQAQLDAMRKAAGLTAGSKATPKVSNPSDAGTGIPGSAMNQSASSASPSPYAETSPSLGMQSMIPSGRMQPTDFAKAMTPYASAAIQSAGIDLDPRYLVALMANETGYGEYARGNNYGGVKALPGQESFNSRTHEYVDGQRVETKADFRSYGSPADSVKDILRTLMHDSRGLHQSALKATNPYDFGYALSGHGSNYATDPYYGKAIQNRFSELYG